MSDEQLMELYFLVRSQIWKAQIGSLTDEAQGELTAQLLTLQRDLKKRLGEEVKAFGYATEWTRDMSADVSSWLSSTLAAGTSTATTFLTTVSVGAALATVDEFNSILSFSGKAAGINLAKGLTEDQVRQFFVEQPLGGKLLQDWVQDAFSAGVQDAIRNAIREGVLAGEGYDKLLERVERAADIGFVRTRQEMLTLVKTYVHSANTGAQEAVYQRNEDVILGYRRYETLDNRTCRQCALCDGLFYRKGEERPALPSHPNCRGMYLAVTKSRKDMGLAMDDFQEELRNWGIREDGSIGTGGQKLLSYGKIKGNFGDWFEQLADDEKKKTSIGTVRTALLKSGRLKWRDMVDKKTGLVKPLQKLGFNRSGQPL